MRVACILPTLGKNLAWLEKSMSSVYEQDSEVIRILAVETITIDLQALCEKYDFGIFKCSARGVFGVLNEVLMKKHTEFDAFFFLGDDDILHSGAVKSLMDSLNEKKLDIVYGKINYIDENGTQLFLNHALPFSKHLLRFFPNLIPNPGTIIKTEVWRKLEGYDPRYKYAADLDFWIRSRKNFRIGTTRYLAASFRYHDNSLTGANREHSTRESEEIRVAGLNPIIRNITYLIQHMLTILGEFWFKHLLRRNS